MSDDWKDKLAALKSNLDPEIENIEDKNEADSNYAQTQSSPLTVITDRKGRNGKTATIVEGFTVPQSLVEELAKKLKQKFGVGGSTREGEILIQGDHKEDVKRFLKENNYKVK